MLLECNTTQQIKPKGNTGNSGRIVKAQAAITEGQKYKSPSSQSNALQKLYLVVIKPGA